MSSTDRVLFLVLLAACTGPTPPTRTDTGEPFVPAPCPPGQSGTLAPEPIEASGGWLDTARFGSGVTFVNGERPWLAVGAPSFIVDEYKLAPIPSQVLVSDVLPIETVSATSMTSLDLGEVGQWSDSVLASLAYGTTVLGVGNVGGGAAPELVLSIVGGVDPSAAFEVDHPTELKGLGDIRGVDYGGAPCGDLDADGRDDLCTHEGIAFGPIAADRAELSVVWTFTGSGPEDSRWDAPARLARLLGVHDRGLLLSDPEGFALHLLRTFPAQGTLDLASDAATTWTLGDQLVTALAEGDLDGDRAPDLVAGVASPSGGAVFVGLDPAGGPLSATTTLDGPVDALVVADFDGDGQDDLAVGGGAEVAVFLGPLAPGALDRSAAAVITRGFQYPDDEYGVTLAAYDWDRDGRAELAVGAPGEGYDPAQVRYGQPVSQHGRVHLYCAGGLP